MSNDTTPAEQGLLTADQPEGTHLIVEHTHFEETEEARVDSEGIVRVRDGTAVYSSGAYDIIEIE